MKTACWKSLSLVAAFPIMLLAACGVTVREEDRGDTKAVDIVTPIGGLSVRTNVDEARTGLPVYPGARPLREDEEPENANVLIGTPLFGLRVVAAKFESDDVPDKILEFYRTEMRTYGSVTECRGEIDFRGRTGSKQPVCKSRPRSRDTQLVAGTEEHHRLVSVKPRSGGSEFAVVSIQTGQSN